MRNEMTQEVLRLTHQPHVGHALMRALGAPDARADVHLQQAACAGGGCSGRVRRPSIAAVPPNRARFQLC